MMGRPDQSKENYTPQEVGTFLGVHHNTIKNWIRRGDIQAFTTVGGHFRVPRREVARLVSGRGLPVPDELAIFSPGVVYVLEREADVSGVLSRALRGSHQVMSFHDPFDALMHMGRLPPDLLVLDLGVGGIDPVALARSLHDGSGRHVPVLAVTVEGGSHAPPRGAFDGVVPGNQLAALLPEKAQELLPSVH